MFLSKLSEDLLVPHLAGKVISAEEEEYNCIGESLVASLSQVSLESNALYHAKENGLVLENERWLSESADFALLSLHSDDWKLVCGGAAAGSDAKLKASPQIGGEIRRQRAASVTCFSEAMEAASSQEITPLGVWEVPTVLPSLDSSAAGGCDPVGFRSRSKSQSFSVDCCSERAEAKQPPFILVEFKSGRTDLFYTTAVLNSLLTPPSVGAHVIVEADRGEDLGRVVAHLSYDRYRSLVDRAAGGGCPQVPIPLTESESLCGFGNAGGPAPVAKRIHRMAQQSEVHQLSEKAQEEVIAMLRCQSKVKQKRYPMEVVDAEYQWDRNKLTFYFFSDRRIDFRELVRDLFRIYKTRIWMCAVDRMRLHLIRHDPMQSAIAVAAIEREEIEDQ